MYNFLKLNKNYVGIGFNLIIKNTNPYIEIFEKNKITKKF
jgi:hypothetical protein